MSFDWSLYLEVAKHLAACNATGKHREAYLRAAITRAYYAAFGEACIHIRRNGQGGIPFGSKHVFVKKWFAAKGDSLSTLVAERLGYLLKERARADYERNHTTGAAMVEYCLMLAADAIDAIRKLR